MAKYVLLGFAQTTIQIIYHITNMLFIHRNAPLISR